MTPDDIALYRAGFASCELAMLVDISTRTVLACDSAVRIGQEHLDEICALACSVLAEDAAIPAASAVVAGPTGCQLFVRPAADRCEVLCSVFSPGTDLTDVEDAAASLLVPEPGGADVG